MNAVLFGPDENKMRTFSAYLIYAFDKPTNGETDNLYIYIYITKRMAKLCLKLSECNCSTSYLTEIESESIHTFAEISDEFKRFYLHSKTLLLNRLI